MSNVTIVKIISATAYEFGVTDSEITGPSRKDVFTRPRFVVCAIAHDSGFSFPQIGKRLGNRDHTTIINAARRAIEVSVRDTSFRESYQRLRDALLGNYAKADKWQFISIRSEK